MREYVPSLRELADVNSEYHRMKNEQVKRSIRENIFKRDVARNYIELATGDRFTYQKQKEIEKHFGRDWYKERDLFKPIRYEGEAEQSYLERYRFYRDTIRKAEAMANDKHLENAPTNHPPIARHGGDR